MARKLTDTVPLMLRLRESLRRKIEKAAKRDRRSMNYEINLRLEKSFPDKKQALIAAANYELACRVREFDAKFPEYSALAEDEPINP